MVCAVGFSAGCGGGGANEALRVAREKLADGKGVEAKTLLEQAISARPGSRDNAMAYNDLGVVNQRLGEDEAAIVAFENSRSLDETLAAPAYNLGILLHNRGDTFRAGNLFDEAARLDPTDPRPLEYRAGMELKKGNWQGARDLLDQALNRAPASARILSTLSLVELRTGETSAATERLLEALDADPAYGPAYFNLAIIHDHWLEDSDSAAHYFERYLEYDTTGESRTRDAERRLAQLRAASGTDSPPTVVEPDEPTGEVILPELPPEDVTAAEVLSNIVAGAEEPLPDHTANVPNPFPELPTDPEPPVIEPEVTEMPPPEPEPEPEPAPEPPPRVSPPPTIEPDPPPRVERPPRPTTISGLVDLGRNHARAGKGTEAYRAFRDAAALAEQSGRDADLEFVLRETVNNCSDQPGAHYDYGLFLTNRNRPAEALSAFRSCVGLAPQWIPAYLGMAETAVRTGQHDAAQAALNRALRLDPVHREAMWGMASLDDHQMNQPKKAIQGYRDFLARYVSDPRAAKARERILALEARTYREPQVTPTQTPTQRPTTVVPTQPPPIATPPNTADAKLPIRAPRTRNSRAAATAFNRGTIYQAREDWERAIFYYVSALEQDDSFAVAYYNLGVAYHNTGERALARSAYKACVKNDPCHVNARFNLALLYREANNPQDAVRELLSVLRCDESHARTHYALGLIYSKSPRNQAEAVRHFERFLRLAPGDSAAPTVRRWLNNQS